MSAVREALAQAAHRLAAGGIDSARADARVLLGHVLGMAPAEVLSAVPQSRQWRQAFDALVERRLKREPVAYITGHKEFWSLDFAVGPGVLVPRPETETLIEEAIRQYPDRSALLMAADLGAGSGCLLVAFLSEFYNAHGVAVEASAEAAKYLHQNAKRVEGRIAIVESDWSAIADGAFDIVFCNPPYLAAHELETVAPELRFEPVAALVSGPDGLEAYRALGPLLARNLKPNGLGFLEIGRGQSESVSKIFIEHGLEIARIAPDLSGNPRCVVVRRPFKKQLE